jgi:hypothetical protein
MGPFHFVANRTIAADGSGKSCGPVRDAVRPRRADDRAVDSDSQRVTIEIVLEAGDGPIRGSMYSLAGGEREFEGWIALAAAVESARRAIPEVVKR